MTGYYNNTISKSNKCTASHQCDKTFTTPNRNQMKKVSDNIESPKDEAYERMKFNFFTFLRENIPFGGDFFDKIQYYPFVQHHKLQFIKRYCSEFKISNQKIVKQWYTDIISDKVS